MMNSLHGKTIPGDGIPPDDIRDLMETIMDEDIIMEVIGLIITAILATAIMEIEDHLDTIEEEDREVGELLSDFMDRPPSPVFY